MSEGKSDERIVRYTAAELAEMRRRGETRTDWERIRNMTEEELEASIDYEEEGEIDWDVEYLGPGPEFTEALLTFRCDADVFDWFDIDSDDPEARISQVLTEHVETERDRLTVDLNFEWDDDKALGNIRKHGIDFLRARTIFDGRPRVDADSSVPHEQRMLSIAMLDEMCVTAVWTERNDKIRLISVRHARRDERTIYQRKTGIGPPED